MRKQELIHVHGLLAEVAEFCSEDGVTVELSSYHDQETRPTSIHQSKSKHRSAVFALATDLTASLPDAEDRSETGERKHVSPVAE